MRCNWKHWHRQHAHTNIKIILHPSVLNHRINSIFDCPKISYFVLHVCTLYIKRNNTYYITRISVDKLVFLSYRVCVEFFIRLFSRLKHRHTLFAVRGVSFALFFHRLLFCYRFCFFFYRLFSFGAVTVLDRNIEMICNLIVTEMIEVNCHENSISISTNTWNISRTYPKVVHTAYSHQQLTCKIVITLNNNILMDCRMTAFYVYINWLCACDGV